MAPSPPGDDMPSPRVLYDRRRVPQLRHWITKQMASEFVILNTNWRIKLLGTIQFCVKDFALSRGRFSIEIETQIRYSALPLNTAK